MNEITRTEMTIDNSGNAIVKQPELTPGKYQLMKDLAQAVYTSHVYKGITSAEAALVVMIKGFELGLGLTSSFEFIQPIQGKFELIPRGALALLHDNPTVKTVEVKRLTNKDDFAGFECRIVRTNGFEYTASFTMDDANRAGLVKPDSGYTKYPENMCMWRAIGFAADVAAPDICAGLTALLKMPEEYGVELTQEGNVIESNFVQPPPPPTEQTTTTEPTTFIKIEDLANKYGAEKILAANQGQIPGTQEELQRVAAKLEADNG